MVIALQGNHVQEMSSKIIEVNEKDTCKDNWNFITLMKELLSNVWGQLCKIGQQFTLSGKQIQQQ